MRTRLAILVICCGLILYCAAALFAEPVVPSVCCGDPGDCGQPGFKCCDPEPLGMTPCSLEMPGICMVVCIPGGGD
jgi:hypothetical protein